MGVHLFISKPLDEASERHGAAFLTAAANNVRGGGRASQKRVDDLYNKLYSPSLLFEDPYTHHGVLWTWGLGWVQHVRPMLTPYACELERPALTWLLGKLNLRHKLPTARAMAAWGIDNTTDVRIAAWHKYYRAKRKEFKKFIERALQMESAVECALNL